MFIPPGLLCGRKYLQKMSSSPETIPYNLRPRKSPAAKNSHEVEASQPYLSSQSKSSDTQDIPTDDEQYQTCQDDLSLDKATDETDAGVSCASDGKDTPADDSKDCHADKTGAGVKHESKKVSATGMNTTVIKESISPRVHQEKNVKSKENPSFLLKICIIPISLVLICYSRGIFILSSFQTPNQIGQITERPVAFRLGNLTEELEHLKAKYTSLDDSFWDIIGGSSWSHVQGDGTFKQPVVLLLVGQPKSAHLEVVANDVASLYSNVFTMRSDSTILIDGSKQAMKEADEAKLYMDSILQKGFRSGSKVTLVTKFDKLPPCSIMLFHSYCDNENAPHKDAVIIFTVELETTVSTEARGKEELVQEHLGTLWAQCPEELPQDKIMAMHSRVSNNIAFVK